ncbi:IS110 family transposase [Methylophaga thalassica]|jgi:transposase|uniref:IS110 family transposase n=1 Tax=Methylophaga thalassica TaxID=40223 RepID=UPI002E7BE56A|nr:IS110 family transposase [Methylophaga thalassica]WVI83754.1 IS110 family transposase [Methylophaga thalassica]|tara:strand:- start:9 stop:1085 length:1077 start_codon:yes stop_codon:yes gene_type:complete
MNNLQTENNEVILGVDTHLDVHVGAVINSSGNLLGTRAVSVSSHGYLDLLEWAESLGKLKQAGVEGTGTYGAGLCRFLTSRGIVIIEVNRPDRSNRRRQGKSDPLNAGNAARAVHSGTATATPKKQHGACEAIRIISVARRSAVKAKTQAMNQIRGILVSGPQDIRELVWKTKPHDCAKACIEMISSDSSDLLESMTETLKLLGQRWLILTDELALLDKKLDKLTNEHCKQLRTRMGVGPYTAGILVTVAGDNPERLRNEAALAALCGVNPLPLPASSGKTIRHRLNRGGNREANNALWTIALVRARSDPRTRLYVARRTAEGLTTKEIYRCLKRYIVRELYPLILSDLKRINFSGLT